MKKKLFSKLGKKDDPKVQMNAQIMSIRGSVDDMLARHNYNYNDYRKDLRELNKKIIGVIFGGTCEDGETNAEGTSVRMVIKTHPAGIMEIHEICNSVNKLKILDDNMRSEALKAGTSITDLAQSASPKISTKMKKADLDKMLFEGRDCCINQFLDSYVVSSLANLANDMRRRREIRNGIIIAGCVAAVAIVAGVVLVTVTKKNATKSVEEESAADEIPEVDVPEIDVDDIDVPDVDDIDIPEIDIPDVSSLL